jgi:hypothetical protein
MHEKQQHRPLQLDARSAWNVLLVQSVLMSRREEPQCVPLCKHEAVSFKQLTAELHAIAT